MTWADGGAPLTPRELFGDNLRLWLDASDECTMEDSSEYLAPFVSAWLDKSPHGNHAVTVGAVETVPPWRSLRSNGTPSVWFSPPLPGSLETGMWIGGNDSLQLGTLGFLVAGVVNWCNSQMAMPMQGPLFVKKLDQTPDLGVALYAGCATDAQPASAMMDPSCLVFGQPLTADAQVMTGLDGGLNNGCTHVVIGRRSCPPPGTSCRLSIQLDDAPEVRSPEVPMTDVSAPGQPAWVGGGPHPSQHLRGGLSQVVIVAGEVAPDRLVQLRSYLAAGPVTSSSASAPMGGASSSSGASWAGSSSRSLGWVAAPAPVELFGSSAVRLWLDATAVDAGAGPLAMLPDRSGFGLDVMAPVGAEPQLDPTGLNGHPTVRFAEGEFAHTPRSFVRFNVALGPAAQSLLVAAVVRLANGSPALDLTTTSPYGIICAEVTACRAGGRFCGTALFGGSAPFVDRLPSGLAGFFAQTSEATRVASMCGGHNDGVARVVVFRRLALERRLELWVNGQLENAHGPLPTEDLVEMANRIHVGGGLPTRDGGVSQQLHGAMSELVVVHGNHTVNQVVQLSRYLQDKYDVR